MTALITLSLAALLLLAAWLLGQLPAAAKRMAVAFGLAAVGSAVVRLAERQQVSETVQTGLLIALAIAAGVVAIWMLQPWLWGIDDYLAEMDAAEDEQQP